MRGLSGNRHISLFFPVRNVDLALIDACNSKISWAITVDQTVIHLLHDSIVPWGKNRAYAPEEKDGKGVAVEIGALEEMEESF